MNLICVYLVLLAVVVVEEGGGAPSVLILTAARGRQLVVAYLVCVCRRSDSRAGHAGGGGLSGMVCMYICKANSRKYHVEGLLLTRDGEMETTSPKHQQQNLPSLLTKPSALSWRRSCCWCQGNKAIKEGRGSCQFTEFCRWYSNPNGPSFYSS